MDGMSQSLVWIAYLVIVSALTISGMVAIGAQIVMCIQYQPLESIRWYRKVRNWAAVAFLIGLLAGFAALSL